MKQSAEITNQESRDKNITWQIMYKVGAPVIVTVVEVFNKHHDLRLTTTDGKVYLFKYRKPQHHLALKGNWCIGKLMSLNKSVDVIISKR